MALDEEVEAPPLKVLMGAPEWVEVMEMLVEKWPTRYRAVLVRKWETEWDSSVDTTVLHYAARQGHAPIGIVLSDMPQEFIAEIHTKDAQSMTPLHLAAAAGHSSICSSLVECKADIWAINDSGWLPLYFSITQNQLGVAELLLGMKTVSEERKSFHI
jgi:ankyrin repeat protein